MTWAWFCTRQGLVLDAANVRRSFRVVASSAGLNPTNGPRGSYATVSVPCSQALDDHRGDRTLGRPRKYKRTKCLYRKELRPDYRWSLRADNGKVIADSGECCRRKGYAIKKAEELFLNALLVIDGESAD